MSAQIAPTSSGQTQSPPRWGIQASIVQPRQPAFWLFLALLGIGAYLFYQEQSLFSQMPASLAVSWGLVLLYAVPVFFIVYRLDLFEREPKLMLAAALIWGGVIAVSLAGYANDAWLSVLGKVAPANFTADWGAALVAPITEETLKLTGVILLFLIVPMEFDGVMDGFVYGALIGLGFTVVEDVSYFIRATAAFGGADQTGPVIDTFLIRIVAGGLYSHVLFAGLTGMGFAYFATQRSQAFARRVFVFVLLVGAGVAAHAVWDSPWMVSVLDTASATDKPSTLQWVEYGVIKGMPFLLLLILMVVLATRSEEKNFRAIVAGEPDPEVFYEPEIKSLGSLWSRRRARSESARLHGTMGSKLTGKLQAAQIEYSMIRSRADSLTDPALDAQRQKIRQIRMQLAGVPLLPAPVRPAPQPVAAPMPAGPMPAAPMPVAAAPSPVPLAAAVVPAPVPAFDVPAVPAVVAEAPAPAPDEAQVETTPTPEPAEVVAAPVPEVPATPEPKPEPAPVETPVPQAAPVPVWAQPAAATQPAAQPAPQPAATPQPAPVPAWAQPAAQPTPAVLTAAQPVAAVAPAAVPAPPPATPAWVPTHLVPPGGMAAWAAPDPSQPPVVNLSERLELVVESRAGAWALVRAVNGWRGWVDGRRLIDRT
jgi:protease PrsW